jgi:hypothetical protein
MGNGDEASGDGWKFRGRGALQLTGKANYQAFADYLKKPEIMTNPDLVATEYALSLLCSSLIVTNYGTSVIRVLVMTLSLLLQRESTEVLMVLMIVKRRPRSTTDG